MYDAPRAARPSRGHGVARIAAFLAWLMSASAPLQGFAATFVVTTTQDNDEALPEQVTLRDAVRSANLSPDLSVSLGPEGE